VIVDVQNDFCSGGALAVPDADAVIPVINELIAGFGCVLFTQDWHPPGHVSFASSHAGRRPFSRVRLPSGWRTLWPDHCIAETRGSAFHARLKVPPGAVIIRKGTCRDQDGYSAFDEHRHTTPEGLDARLREAGVGELVLVGLATDFCVFQTAIDARARGYEVTVIESGCRGIVVQGSLRAAWTEMARAGVRRA